MSDGIEAILWITGFVVGIPLLLFGIAKLMGAAGDGINRFPVHTITFKTGDYQDIELRQGGFWHRWAAYFIDGFIVGIISKVFLFGGSGVYNWATLALMLVYSAGFEGSEKQATPGKLTMKLRVIRADGTDVSYSRALARNTAKILGPILVAVMFGIIGGLLNIGKPSLYMMLYFLVFLIDCLFIFWTPNNQALHDIIAGCMVVRAPTTVPQKQNLPEAGSEPADGNEVVPG
ncbi:MAG: RDD family protein [Deltaproteobacteria bacterium]